MRWRGRDRERGHRRAPGHLPGSVPDPEGEQASRDEPEQDVGHLPGLDTARPPDDGPDGGAPALRRRGRLASPREILRALSPVGGRRVAMTFFAVGTFGVLAVLGVTYGAMSYTSTSEFCSSCHPMDPFSESWVASPHSEVKCSQCHMEPGFLGYVSGKVAGIGEVVAYLTVDEEHWELNAVVSNRVCLSCHEDILEEDVLTDGPSPVLVAHDSMVETGGKCLFCHSTTAHGDEVPLGSQTQPTMAECFRCHDGEIAPMECSTCHTTEVDSADQPHLELVDGAVAQDDGLVDGAVAEDDALVDGAVAEDDGG
jgi:nitrate/TMAO reductase-like tetraheme cytochrome c subunit